MRLICPRCGAQYEVDDSVIPTSGRDVQCSGCGQTWFQPSRQMLDAAQETARETEAQDELDQWDVEETPAAAPVAAPSTEPLPELEPEPAPEPWPEPLPEDWPEDWPEPEPEANPAPSAETEPPPAAPADEVAEVLDWAVPPVETASEPAKAETAPEPDVTEAIAELMRRHPVALAEPRVPTTAAVPSATPLPAPVEPPAPDAAGLAGEVGPAPRAGAVPRRALDENLMAILREEAEREAAARRSEGSDFQTQQEMVLDPVLAPHAAPTPVPVPTPIERPRAAEPPPAPMPAVAPRPVAPARVDPARRVPDFSDLNSALDDEDDRHADLTEGPEPEGPAKGGRFTRSQRLPDIDEINSSLRASADRAGDIAAMGARPDEEDERSGFRFGFSSVLLLAAIAALLYAYAPQLSNAVPALAPLLETYVSAVDAARIWLDEQLRAVIANVKAGAPPQG